MYSVNAADTHETFHRESGMRLPLKPQDLVFLDRLSHQMLWSSPDRTWRGALIGALTADRTGPLRADRGPCATERELLR